MKKKFNVKLLIVVILNNNIITINEDEMRCENDYDIRFRMISIMSILF